MFRRRYLNCWPIALYIFINKFRHMAGYSPVWIGGSDRETESVFKWEQSGALFDYAHWSPQATVNSDIHSINDCVALVTYDEGVLWRDISCGAYFKAICAYEWLFTLATIRLDWYLFFIIKIHKEKSKKGKVVNVGSKNIGFVFFIIIVLVYIVVYC